MTAYTEDSANSRRGKSIHTDPEIARAAGFPATVAQGMMAADYISEMLTNAFGKEWFEYASLSLSFLKPMLCGDTITARARLASEMLEGSVVRKVYAVWAENQDGAMVAAGSAGSLVMPRR
jgi:acyl dehydratase